MRGRVSAVNSLFLGASNEFGEFESGVTAQWLGPVRAVIYGGIGSLMVTGLWAWFFPTLRKADRLTADSLLPRKYCRPNKNQSTSTGCAATDWEIRAKRQCWMCPTDRRALFWMCHPTAASVFVLVIGSKRLI